MLPAQATHSRAAHAQDAAPSHAHESLFLTCSPIARHSPSSPTVISSSAGPTLPPCNPSPPPSSSSYAFAKARISARSHCRPAPTTGTRRHVHISRDTRQQGDFSNDARTAVTEKQERGAQASSTLTQEQRGIEECGHRRRQSILYATGVSSTCGQRKEVSCSLLPRPTSILSAG